MAENNKPEPYAHGTDMWREYAARYGAISARIICRRYLELQANTTDSNEREFCRQLRKAIMLVPNMTSVAVYLRSAGFAALNGETELYKDSDKANYLCAGDIDAAMFTCEYGDGTHDFGYAAALTDHYGLERVKLVLAAEANRLGFAGQISDDAYEWARSFKLGDHFYGGFHLRTGPDVLERLISEIRKEEKYMDMNKLPSKETLIRLREQYPEGTRIELMTMSDPYTNIKPGDKGSVSFIDDTGTIFVDWDNGSSLGLVYGEDRYRKIENEIVKNQEAQPEQTVTYTLNELLDVMEPQARRDKDVIIGCIDGLTYYAAYKASENGFASEVTKIRELIETLVPYWGLDNGSGEKSLEDFLDSYDALIDDAKRGVGIGRDRDKICTDILRGLYRHGLEMVAAQGDGAMGDILSVNRLITDVAGYFDYESEAVNQMNEKLVGEVREMLNGYEMPGQNVKGIANVGYGIERAVLFNNDRGFAFAGNPNAASPYVTWQMYNNDGNLSFESGNYYNSREAALVNFISRTEDYRETYKLTEKQLPDQQAEPPKNLIRFIDSDYRELFQIPDGESINITYPPGDGREMATRECRFHDECHFSLKNGGIYHICQFAEAMERIGAKYEPAKQVRDMKLLPFTAGEDKFYAPNRDEVNTSVGIMSGDFGRDGDRFQSNWIQKGGGEYTAEVQSELQSVIYALRQDLLKDHNSMLAYCNRHPEARLPETDKFAVFGFKAETDTRQYFVRCFAERDSRFNIYAYADKPAREIKRTAISQKQNGSIDENTVRTKISEKNTGGYTSVLKAIEEGKKTPKPPRKVNDTAKHKNKNEEL